MSRPIPKSVLIHQAIYLTGKTTDDWGNTTYANKQPIYNVRFEPSGRLTRSKDNQELQLSLLMFYDQRNSRPSGLVFKVDEQIEYKGQTYTIVSNDLEHDEKGLHHQEVGLV